MFIPLSLSQGYFLCDVHVSAERSVYFARIICTSPAASGSSFFTSSLPSPQSANLSSMECNARTSRGHHKRELPHHNKGTECMGDRQRSLIKNLSGLTTRGSYSYFTCPGTVLEK